ncbi:hypothetical protein [Rahnella contaminans]|uniref:hypothetical protein n=1 Tax=Rahnella contaminans TaxID=2703882 RepID=UPI0023D9934D|nr:hypothetical protein [Rahnella contaminans]MDF1895099.1 hypothetical protein [Rahnella contaminans]
MKLSFALFLLLLSIHAQAECWVVGNLQGMGTSKSDNYLYSKDGMTGQTFKIQASKEHSSVEPGDLDYFGINQKSVIGVYTDGSSRTVETWNITYDNKNVLYTQMRTGFNDMFDGSKSFVGTVISKC